MLSSSFVIVFPDFLSPCEAEAPGNGGNNLLLTEEFIRNCVELFSVPSRGLESNLRAFPQKHLNIIDPLKENNNLGRSVNRGTESFTFSLSGFLNFT